MQNDMEVSRRGFLVGGVAAFGSLFVGRLFAAPPGWKHGGRPNLVFGVLSDTHLISSRGAVEKLVWNRNGGRGVTENGSPDKYLLSALKYFYARNVDAVMHCGDMADEGLVSEMEWTANAWRIAFPKDRAKDGRKVEKLFVSGNHEIDRMWRVERDYPDLADRKRRMLSTDIAKHWKRIWGETYEQAWHKEVKGYHFFGRQYGNATHGVFASLLATASKELGLNKGTKPFFIVSHTGYWYREKEAFRRSISRFCRNGVAFFGHHHWSVANWKRIFFSVSPELPEIQCPPCGVFGEVLSDKDAVVTGVQLKGSDKAGGRQKQFLVVSVYDDLLVIERYDCGDGIASLGADWVMPLGKRNPHPFSRDELKKVIGEPQFRKGAKLEVGWAMKGAKKTNGTKETPSGSDAASGPSVPSLRLKIPLADGNHDSRVYAYEVEVAGENAGKKLLKAVYAAGCNMGIGHEPNKGVTTLEIPKSELPPGKAFAIAVRPLSSLGTSGKPIVAEFKV